VYTGAGVLVVATAAGVEIVAVVVTAGCGVRRVVWTGVAAGVTVADGVCAVGVLPVQPAKSAETRRSPVTIPMRIIWVTCARDIVFRPFFHEMRAFKNFALLLQ
jgi:hypothetical protein